MVAAIRSIKETISFYLCVVKSYLTPHKEIGQITEENDPITDDQGCP